MKERAYHEKVNIENEKKLRVLMAELPRFCREFFIGIEPTTSSRTRIAYAYDLGVFFNYLHENNPALAKMEITDYPVAVLDEITALDIEEYMMYLKYYVHNGVEHTNDERGQMRKLATLRSFYNYFFRKEIISKNPASLVQMPKRHEKNIVRLDIDEVALLLDEAESGEKLTARQKMYHEKTKKRDLAILTLLLGTGIRVSECVGLDIQDIDPKNNGIKIHRKGGKEMMVYFGDEVARALDDYLDERLLMKPQEGSTEALFLSLQNKRICRQGANARKKRRKARKFRVRYKRIERQVPFCTEFPAQLRRLYERVAVKIFRRAPGVEFPRAEIDRVRAAAQRRRQRRKTAAGGQNFGLSHCPAVQKG